MNIAAELKFLGDRLIALSEQLPDLDYEKHKELWEDLYADADLFMMAVNKKRGFLKVSMEQEKRAERHIVGRSPLELNIHQIHGHVLSCNEHKGCWTNNAYVVHPDYTRTEVGSGPTNEIDEKIKQAIADWKPKV